MTSKKGWRKWWRGTYDQFLEFGCCFLGVLAYKALDVVGQELTLQTLSLGYVGFALGLSLMFTIFTDNDTIPADIDPDAKRNILKRMAKKALLMGFFWQTVLEKFKELIEV